MHVSRLKSALRPHEREISRLEFNRPAQLAAAVEIAGHEMQVRQCLKYLHVETALTRASVKGAEVLW